MVKIGIIREDKQPEDNRTPLTPQQCAHIRDTFEDVEILVQSSPKRCYSDEEYEAAGIPVKDQVDECDILMGVKEVPQKLLIPGKTYLFFSHTIKKQPYNRELLRTVLQKNIRLIDYETLTDDDGMRVIAFGRWAGIVGAHNALWTYGKRTGAFDLPRAKDVKDYQALQEVYEGLGLPHFKIAITGSGRVAHGTWEIMKLAGVQEIEPFDYLSHENENSPVFCKLFVNDLYKSSDEGPFSEQDFFTHPEKYHSRFEPFSETTDVMINAIYWDPAAPIYFSLEDMKADTFRISTIADITCDIEGSVPATLKATTIDDPVFGFDPQKGEESESYKKENIDIMSVDNLPNELPRDASQEFGEAMITHVLPNLLKVESDMIRKASITKDGDLTKEYEYLRDYVEGK